MPGPVRPIVDDLLGRQTVRFVIAGGSAAALFYGLTVAFIRFGAPPFAGSLAAYAIAFVAAYTVQHTWTFRGGQAHRRSLPRYLMAQGIAALVAGTAARLAGDLGAPATVVAAASTLSGSALSFVLSKYWVFTRHEPRTTVGA